MTAAAPAAELAGRLRAAGFMLGCAAGMAVASALAKGLGRGGGGGQGLHPFQITHARFAVALLVVAAVAAVLRPSLAGTPLALHLGRTLAGWLGASALFAAAAAMPLAEATAVSFLNPVLTMLLAIPLLAERIGPWRWLGAGVALAGGMLLIRPGTAAFQPMALVALAAAVLFALEAIAVKLIGRRQSPLPILLVNNALGLGLSSAAAAFVWVWPAPGQWPLLAGVGLAVVSAQACFLMAMRAADASFCAPFFYATLVFAAAIDLATFGEAPDALAALGAGTVVAGALLIAWRDRAATAGLTNAPRAVRPPEAGRRPRARPSS
jgi:drug/metabolite transporter (DMT)-like permease